MDDGVYSSDALNLHTASNERGETMDEVKKLRDVLRALTEANDAGIALLYAGNDYYACIYCDVQADERADVQHAPDCPIVLGRALLLNIDREWEQMPPAGKEFGSEQEAGA